MSVANDVKEFRMNDIVYRIDKRKKINFGVVDENYESDPDCDLQKGQISVEWLNSSRTTVCKQSKVRLISRGNVISSGCIVRRLENDVETQRGYCKESKHYATVAIIGTDRIIERVASERFTTVAPLEKFATVCLENKCCRIQSSDYKLTMQSKCGSIVEIISSINKGVNDYLNRDGFKNHYVGQEVTCTPNSLHRPNWIYRSKAMKRSQRVTVGKVAKNRPVLLRQQQFTLRKVAKKLSMPLQLQRFIVQKVEPTDIKVFWCDSTSSVSGVKAEDIPKLKVIEVNPSLEFGERRFLTLNSSDNLIKARDWVQKQSASHQPSSQKLLHIVNGTSKAKRGPKLRCPSLLCTCVNTTESEEEQGERSDNDSPSISTSVTRQQSRRRHFSSKNRKVVPGHTIVVQILYVDTTATILWQDGTEEKNVSTVQLLASFDTNHFLPGEWVMQEGKRKKQHGVIQHVNFLERTAMVKWFRWSEENQNPELVSTNEMSTYDLHQHPTYKITLNSVVKRIPLEGNKLGSVLSRSPEGYVTVEWIDGTRENCWPHNLELMGKLNFKDFQLSMKYKDYNTAESWYTLSIENIVGDSNEPTLPNIAAQLDILRGRAIYLMEILKQRNTKESCYILKEVFIIYENCIRLDKLLGTSFFSIKNTHFQVLLDRICEKLKLILVHLIKQKKLDRFYMFKINKLQEILKYVAEESGEPETPLSPDSEPLPCLELLSMMKVRMDLAYYTLIISHIGDSKALTIMTKASDAIIVTSASLSNLLTTPEESASAPNLLNLAESVITCENDVVYSLLDEVHVSHHFYNNQFEPTDRQRFFKAFQKEFKLLKESLPPGVWVRSYANRMDLLSVMVRGPSKTPYEDSLFLFDLQLSKDYPISPPACHYISYSSERLNPNLYVEGRVCISLLGTWMGRDTEKWSANSTLLQLIVSIQGLILVSEPYYNEAGYEKQVENQEGYENSRTYNELIILKLVRAMSCMLLEPPEVFKQEIYCHFSAHGENMYSRLQSWCNDANPVKPEFPLLPVSKGFKLSLSTSLKSFLYVLKDVLKTNATSCEAGIVSSEPHV